MKNQKKTELKVGLTVIVGIIILLWVLGWAKNFSFNSDEKNLAISFDNVAGLSVGDFVSVQGIKSGYVEKIYNQDNKVIAEVSLNKNIDLRQDATYSVMMVDLMGGKKIEIAPGSSANQLDYSKIQNGQFLGDIATSMAVLGSVQNDLVEVIFQIKDALTSFNKIMNDSKFTDELRESVGKLNQLISKTDKIISENGDSFSELLKNSNELVANSNKFILDNKDEIKISLENINGLVKSTNSLISKIDKFVVEVENKENNLGKIMYDEEIIENLTSSLRELKKLSKTINEQINKKGLKVDANVF
jgi:phospholipid/cholesterol/gamma-HCH transport system substrate-binding protein